MTSVGERIRKVYDVTVQYNTIQRIAVSKDETLGGILPSGQAWQEMLINKQIDEEKAYCTAGVIFSVIF